MTQKNHRSFKLRWVLSLVDIIGIGLEQQCDAVNQAADTEEAEGEEVQDAHADFALVELMGTECAEEEAEQECDPLVLGAQSDNGDIVDIVVGIRIGICVVDHDAGLLGVLQFLDLTAAVGAQYSGGIDLLAAVLAELGGLLCSGGGDGILVHAIFLLVRYRINECSLVTEIGTTLLVIIRVHCLFVK